MCCYRFHPVPAGRTSGHGQGLDAITLLKDDHKTVEALFKRFEKAGDRAFVEKREIVDRVIAELSKYAAIGEMLFYPVTRATVPETEDIVLERLEEHQIVKWVLSELDGSKRRRSTTSFLCGISPSVWLVI